MGQKVGADAFASVGDADLGRIGGWMGEGSWGSGVVGWCDRLPHYPAIPLSHHLALLLPRSLAPLPQPAPTAPQPDRRWG